MAVRLVLGILAVLRAALVYGEGAELASRPLAWPSLRLPRLWSHTRGGPISHPVIVAVSGDRREPR